MSKGPAISVTRAGPSLDNRAMIARRDECESAESAMSSWAMVTFNHKVECNARSDGVGRVLYVAWLPDLVGMGSGRSSQYEQAYLAWELGRWIAPNHVARRSVDARMSMKKFPAGLFPSAR